MGDWITCFWQLASKCVELSCLLFSETWKLLFGTFYSSRCQCEFLGSFFCFFFFFVTYFWQLSLLFLTNSFKKGIMMRILLTSCLLLVPCKPSDAYERLVLGPEWANYDYKKKAMLEDLFSKLEPMLKDLILQMILIRCLFSCCHNRIIRWFVLTLKRKLTRPEVCQTASHADSVHFAINTRTNKSL